MKHVRAMLGKLPADADEPVIVDQLQCVSRLRVISLALGAEAMQKDLIPFILELCERRKVEPPRRLVDEVLTSLAEMLGSMDEFVGAKNAHILFKPLTILCSVDETTVRQQAVDSINKLSAALSPAQVAEHLGGEVIKLMENTDWFTPRVSGVGLVATTYAKVAEASLKSVPITRFSESRRQCRRRRWQGLAECFRGVLRRHPETDGRADGRAEAAGGGEGVRPRAHTRGFGARLHAPYRGHRAGVDPGERPEVVAGDLHCCLALGRGGRGLPRLRQRQVGACAWRSRRLSARSRSR